MLGLYVTVPITCFRKGSAREYLETEPVPPPATCYGFLLSLVGETDRRRHVGVRIAPGLLSRPPTSVVLRTVWRVKRMPLGSPGNTRPDYQQLLTGVELLMWMDSTEEVAGKKNLEQRVRATLADPAGTRRFGGLSLGESAHLVDEVSLLKGARTQALVRGRQARVFLQSPRGRLSLPVWVDHVGSAGTRYAVGDLVAAPIQAPEVQHMPRIHFQ